MVKPQSLVALVEIGDQNLGSFTALAHLELGFAVVQPEFQLVHVRESVRIGTGQTHQYMIATNLLWVAGQGVKGQGGCVAGGA